jgi:hypothetical protein
MIKHAASHVDHGLNEVQLRYILDQFVDKTAFFITTIELPEELGTVPCGLYGPLMGDAPIPEGEVVHQKRGTRAWTSRLIDKPLRPTRKVTVIGGPHDGHPCILYTCYGGPQAPQEPGDPGCKDPAASATFWREHALAK